MSFRQYGGINYAAKNNIVKNNYGNSNILSVMTKVGQPYSIINFESDISGNSIYGSLDVSGNVNISQDLDVSGNVNISQDLDVSGNIIANRITTIYDSSFNGITVGRGGGNLENNTAVGYKSLYNSTGQLNTAFGYESLYTNNSGESNTAIGVTSLYSNTTGKYNTAIGVTSLYNNTTGKNNTSLGYNAGIYNNAGYNNTFLGSGADWELSSYSSLTNSTAIGYNAKVNASNQIVLGNSSISSLKCAVALTVTSDSRDKTNFEPLDAGMNFINEMKPLRFDWNQREGGLEGRKDVGFTAQDLLEAQEITGIKIPNLVDTHNPEKYTVMYTQVIPILVKAVQELSSTVTRLEAEIEELKNVKN